MKGKQTLVFSYEAIIEALEEYLQKRSVERVTVSSFQSIYDENSVQVLSVKFTSEPEVPAEEGRG